MNQMKTSDRGRALITELEGKRNVIYLDPIGLMTIGVGHLMTKDELTSGKISILGIPTRYTDDGLTDLQIDQLLTQDLASAEGAVNVGIEIELNQDRFDALVSLTFNIGRQAFLNSTLRKVLNNGEYEEAEKQIARWNRAGNRIIPGLQRRRLIEIDWFRGTFKCQH